MGYWGFTVLGFDVMKREGAPQNCKGYYASQYIYTKVISLQHFPPTGDLSRLMYVCYFIPQTTGFQEMYAFCNGYPCPSLRSAPNLISLTRNVYADFWEEQ